MVSIWNLKVNTKPSNHQNNIQMTSSPRNTPQPITHTALRAKLLNIAIFEMVATPWILRSELGQITKLIWRLNFRSKIPRESKITQHCGPNCWKRNFKMATNRHIGFWAPRIAPTLSGGTPWLDKLIQASQMTNSPKILPYLPMVTELSQMTQLVYNRVFLSWSLIHGSSWSDLIKVGPV